MILFNSIFLYHTYTNQKLISLWQNLKFHYKMFQEEEEGENEKQKNWKHCYKESEKKFYFTSFLPSFITMTFIVTPSNIVLQILCIPLFLLIKSFWIWFFWQLPDSFSLYQPVYFCLSLFLCLYFSSSLKQNMYCFLFLFFAHLLE